LQSIIGAPVFSRSSFTCVAEIFAIVVLIRPQVSMFQSFRVSMLKDQVSLGNVETLKL